MTDALSSAHTWFLESYRHGPNADVVIQVVEGIKGKDRLPVEVVEGTVLGHYFPVTVEPHSRCATIRFANVRAVFTFAETYDTEDPKLKMSAGDLARSCDDSSFRGFVQTTTTALESFRGEFSEWLVWTEDQVFQILTNQPPDVRLDDRAPDLSIERGNTWSAS